MLLVIPTTLQNGILENFHDNLTGGHLGRDKTLEKIKARYYWVGMAADVKSFVARCPVCLLSKRPKQYPRASLKNFQAGMPNDRVHLDILGPFCQSLDGNRCVLMIIDQFTRWVEMVAVPNQEAETLARTFFDTYVARFGVPFFLHTDQGRNFDGNFMQAFCDLLDISKTRTTPYHPSSNGQVERYNQLVLTFLRCF